MKIKTLLCLLMTCFGVLTACQTETKNVKQGNASNDSQNTKPQPTINTPTFNADSAFTYVKKQVDFGPRVPTTPAHKNCAAWLSNTLKQWADTVIVQAVEIKSPRTQKNLPCYNITASFNPENKNNRIVLASHWDSRPMADEDTQRQNEPILAANDGASGVGVLLEIARILKANPLNNIGIDIVFFDIEDDGVPEVPNSYCLGSQYWSRHLPYATYSPRYGVLLDMVGAKNATFYQELNSMTFAPSVVLNIWNNAATLGYSNFFIGEQTQNAITDDHFYVSQLANFPMIDIIHYTPQSTFGSYWHTHNDNMEIIDRSTLKAVGQTVLYTIFKQEYN